MTVKHHMWGNPTTNPEVPWTHNIWTVGHPMTRWNVNKCNLTTGNATTPPTLYSNGSATGFTAQALTAAGAGIQGAQWAKYFKTEMELRSLTYTGYSLLLQGFGVPNEDDFDAMPANCPPLCQHPSDAVQITGGQAEVEVSSPFVATGVAACTTWANTCLNSYEAQRITYGVAVPGELNEDMEKDPNEQLWCRDDGKGVFAPSLADARAATEIIDGVSTLAQRYAAGLDINGAALTFDPNKNMQRQVNMRFAEWASGERQRIGETALYTSLVVKAVALWSSIKSSNFSYLASTRAHPWPASRAWRNDFGYDMRHLHRQQPTFYPLNNTAFAANGASSYAQQLARYGVTPVGVYQTDLDALNLARWKRILANAMLARPDLPIIPSMICPGFTVALDNIQAGLVYGPSTGMIEDFSEHAATVANPPSWYWWHSDVHHTLANWNSLYTIINGTINPIAVAYSDADYAVSSGPTITLSGTVRDRVVLDGTAVDQ